MFGMRWKLEQTETVIEVLERAVARAPDNIFLEYLGKTYTYAEFDVETTKLAHGLRKKNVAKGDAVATMLDNSDEAILIWFAINKLGAISVPLNTALKGEFLHHQLSDSGASLVIAEAAYLPRIDELKEALPSLKTLLCRGEPNPYGSAQSFASLWTEDATSIEGGPAFNDLAMLVYTSGTTGPSKGCMIGHNYLCYFAGEQAWALGMRQDDIIWTPLPLFHLGAIGAVVLMAMRVGARMSLYPQFSLSKFWPEIERTKATVTLAPASMGVLIAEAPDTDVSRRCYGQLRVVGGVPFSAELTEKWRKRFGVKYVGAPGYGMTELSMVTLHPLHEPSPPGSSGRRFDDVDVRILDENGFECPDGTAGEVVLRTRKPHIMFYGYWRRPEETVKAFDQLWFHTGDLGRFDKEGFFFFVDRKKDYMRRRGENISSYELENAFRKHPAIEDVAAHAVLSKVSEDDVKVTIVLKENTSLSEEDLCRWCLDKIPFYAVPRYIEFRAELPKNPFGRVLKYQLREEGATPTTWDREKYPSIVVTR